MSKDHTSNRDDLVKSEKCTSMGGTLSLSAKEQQVNEHLMEMKRREMSDTDGDFPPSQHFYRAKEAINASGVFQFIRTMPKGGALHLHDFASIDMMWLIKHATYDPNCYMQWDGTGPKQFHFYPQAPDAKDGIEWTNVVEFRKSSGNPEEFDEMLYKHLTVVDPNPEEKFPTQGAIWSHFHGIFFKFPGLLTYVPVFKAFYTELMRSFLEDNVQYLETRCRFFPMYELDGTVRDRDWVIDLYKSLTEQFIKENPTFLGVKYIYVGFRRTDKSTVATDIQDVVGLVKKHPEHILGFDLVGHEDTGNTLEYYLEELQKPSTNGDKLDYYFHAGETNWQGQGVDTNLIDAILLNTRRIGHGYAVPKHPEVMNVIKERGIALEVNPISNQVLMLVKDLRNHAMVPLIAQDFPIVISSDDPGLWGALPLSHDFYEAFMGMAGAHADLRMLKQCAINSITYSGMSEKEKTAAMASWEEQWRLFIEGWIRIMEAHDTPL